MEARSLLLRAATGAAKTTTARLAWCAPPRPPAGAAVGAPAAACWSAPPRRRHALSFDAGRGGSRGLTAAAGAGTGQEACCFGSRGAERETRARRRACAYSHPRLTLSPSLSSLSPLSLFQQVEVKLRLPDAAAHAAVAAALGGPAARKATHHQENFFFDGPGKELASQRAVLRVRFYDTDRRALITLKGKQVLVDGIGRGTEVEVEAPDPKAAREWVSRPAGLLALDVPLIRDGVAARFGVTSLVCLGGFENVRQEFPFAGHTLELDETRFAWGTLYEVEVESARPEEVKAELEALLKGKGVPFSYSSTTKFHNFITGGKAEEGGE